MKKDGLWWQMLELALRKTLTTLWANEFQIHAAECLNLARSNRIQSTEMWWPHFEERTVLCGFLFFELLPIDAIAAWKAYNGGTKMKF